MFLQKPGVLNDRKTQRWKASQREGIPPVEKLVPAIP